MKTLLCLLASTILCSAAKPAPFTPVSGFDLNRYLGTWYEVARFPHSFEKGLQKVTANYSLMPDGKVKVTNEGYKKGSSKPSVTVGNAKYAGATDIGHLKVSFFGPFYADYIIVDLAPDYSYALVLSSSMNFLWILSRTPTLDPAVIAMLTQKARSLGFDMSRIIMVSQ